MLTDISSPQSKRIGHFFFWYLRSEVAGCPFFRERMAVILEAYLMGCGQAMLSSFQQQVQVVDCLHDVASAVKRLFPEKSDLPPTGKDNLLRNCLQFYFLFYVCLFTRSDAPLSYICIILKKWLHLFEILIFELCSYTHKEWYAAHMGKHWAITTTSLYFSLLCTKGKDYFPLLLGFTCPSCSVLPYKCILFLFCFS